MNPLQQTIRMVVNSRSRATKGKFGVVSKCKYSCVGPFVFIVNVKWQPVSKPDCLGGMLPSAPWSTVNSMNEDDLSQSGKFIKSLFKGAGGLTSHV